MRYGSDNARFWSVVPFSFATGWLCLVLSRPSKSLQSPNLIMCSVSTVMASELAQHRNCKQRL